MYSAHKFVIPASIPEKRHVSYCLEIIRKYRKELAPFRKQQSLDKRRIDYLEEQLKDWQEQYKQEKSKRSKVEKENNQLKKEIEKLTTTNYRYKVSLFDHGNFTDPGKSSKSKGGQEGHKDTNREAQEDYQTYNRKRLSLKACPTCQHKLRSVTSTSQKVLIDIVLNPQIVKLILESERQWCSHCHKGVQARDERSLPFTEYGINIVMIILILRFRCLLPYSKIGTVLNVISELELSKSVIVNLLTQSKKYLKGRYKELLTAVRRGEIMYNDETGWQVRGKNAWLWIAANEDTTIYQAAESRGHGVIKTMYGDSRAQSMHDGYSGYNWIAEAKTMYCWAHLLRFAYEETHALNRGSPGYIFRNKLVQIYGLINKRDAYTENTFREILTKRLSELIKQKSEIESIRRIQFRLSRQKRGLIQALLYSPDGTNNLAERELRPMVLMRKTSFGSDTFSGMETSAILGSVIQTLHRQQQPLVPSLKQYLQRGIKHKYPNQGFV